MDDEFGPGYNATNEANHGLIREGYQNSENCSRDEVIARVTRYRERGTKAQAVQARDSRGRFTSGLSIFVQTT